MKLLCDKVGHRITGDRTQRARHVGWEYVFVAVDGHSRIASTRTCPDDKQARAIDVVRQATGCFASPGVPMQRVLSDNDPAFHLAAFGAACLELGLAQKSYPGLSSTNQRQG